MTGWVKELRRKLSAQGGYHFWLFLLFNLSIWQIHKAYEYLTEHWDCPAKNLRFKVSTDGNRGIYLRDYAQLSKPHEKNVNIEPIFAENTGEFYFKFLLHFKPCWFISKSERFCNSQKERQTKNSSLIYFFIFVKILIKYEKTW